MQQQLHKGMVLLSNVVSGARRQHGGIKKEPSPLKTSERSVPLFVIRVFMSLCYECMTDLNERSDYCFS